MKQTLSAPVEKKEQPSSGSGHPAARVCMHVLGVARTDVRVMREATALAQAGMVVSIVDFEKDRTRPREEEVTGIHLKHSSVPRGWYTPARFKPLFLVKLAQAFILGALEVLRTPADVYHAHDERALPACYIAARLRRKPLIFDAHELPLVQAPLTRWRRLCALSSWVLSRMMARCAGVITVSPPIVDQLQQRFGGPPAVLVRNVPVYQSPLASDRLRQQLGLSSQTRIALYQGAISLDRDLDQLVQAAKFLNSNIVIVMIGRGPVREQLEALIQEEGVSDRVKLFPWVPYEELLALTAAADLGLALFSGESSLSVKLCLPNKFFEYLMAGLPVLASSLEAVVDFIQTYDVGCVVPALSPAEIARAINAMLADSAALARMRHNALVAARQDLRWDVEQQHLLRLYQNVLSN